MSNQNSITIRVLEIAKKLIDEKRVKSFSKLSTLIGSTPQNITEIKKGRRNFTVEQIDNFITLFELDARDIFCYSNANNSIKQIHPIAVDYAGNERVVLVDQKAAAGYLNGFEDPEYIASLPTMSAPPHLAHKSLYGFEVFGDSMEPNIYHSEWVLGSVMEKLDWIHLNYIHILVCDEGIVVKRITEINKEEGCLTLASDNELYPPYQVPLKEVKRIFFLEVCLRTKFPQKDKSLEARLSKLESKLE